MFKTDNSRFYVLDTPNLLPTFNASAQPLGIGRYDRRRVEGTHITAKTKRGVRCTGTPSAVASITDRGRRIQMLEDRRAARS
ncbi:MAG: hypothetical protein ABW128_16945 [Rhizorhabdus sp.]